MGLGSNGYDEKWMGVMDLGSNEPWEYWTFVKKSVFGSNEPWEYSAFRVLGPWEYWALGVMGPGSIGSLE